MEKIKLSQLGEFKDSLPVIIFLKKLYDIPFSEIKYRFDTSAATHYARTISLVPSVKNVIFLVKTKNKSGMPLSFELDLFFDSYGINDPFSLSIFLNNRLADTHHVKKNTFFDLVDIWKNRSR